MANILDICKRLFKRRKHERFKVQDSTFVIVAPGERKVQIVDISMGGAAFVYAGSPKDLQASGALKLLTEEANLGKLKFDTVSDILAPGCAQSSEILFRRRGVKFKWLGVLDEAELNKFIKKVGIFPT